MKKYLIVILFLCVYVGIYAQTDEQQTDNTVKLTDLAVPTSPAFLLMDVGSTSIESPVNPKEFALGLAQDFDADSKWFNDYSLEFTPYWWVKPGGRSAYSFMGLSKGKGTEYHQDIWSGLKFTSVSLAFINKDMVPDSIEENQKIFSLGVRTTVLKIRNNSYADALNNKLKDFHEILQKQLKEIDDSISAILADPVMLGDAEKTQAKIEEVTRKIQKKYLADAAAANAINELKNIIEEKPLLNLDVAGAFSQYGIGDTVWKTGRTGIWATLSSFTPLSKEKDNDSYIDILASVRYLNDNYVKDNDGFIKKSATTDAGIKIGIEINKFSLYGEGMWRKVKKQGNWENRVTGILNYKIQDNLYLSGTYGTDYGPAKKLIALFGINWGFGADKVNAKPE